LHAKISAFPSKKKKKKKLTDPKYLNIAYMAAYLVRPLSERGYQCAK